MQTISYKTGRTYSKPQVLAITVETQSEDDYGFNDVVATFVDESRGIAGRVSIVLADDDLGQSVLKAYDAGQYQTI
jgi:hypothetical protein